jgi:hypothetical protein
MGIWIITALWPSFSRSCWPRGRVRARAVELVDEGDAGHVVAAHLAVDGDRLALHTGDTAQHQDGAIEHAQGPLHLDGEVDVARGVDDVDVEVVFQWQCVAADWIVMPRSRSSSIESILAPTPSLPRTSWMAWIRSV